MKRQEFKIHNQRKRTLAQRWLFSVLVVFAATACTPTVRVATDKPITINLNVKIEHEIKIKVDKELDDLFANDSELF